MKTLVTAALVALWIGSVSPAPRPAASQAPRPPGPLAFKRVQLSDQFWSEGANAGDLNNDGIFDVISGPWWWEGPDFTRRHEYYAATTTFQLKLGPMTTVTVPGFEGALGRENKYSDNFFIWVHDFNKDRWNDILMVGFPGTATSWFENPKGAGTHWRRHTIFAETDNESPTFADLTGDGKPELVCITKGQYGYAEPDWTDPAKPWTFHPLSPNNKYGKFTHGMGLGDVNGDRRLDLLEKNGWWEQPASLAGDPIWRFHPQPFGSGGSQMYAYDVNGDGLADIITSLAAHAFGLAWYEQYRDGGAIKFREHVIMNKEPRENAYGVKFSELHAIDLVDMDGDGLKDIVTGKRFWSHGRTGDPDRNDAAVLYWFKLARGRDRSVDFIPYLIDDNSGVGTQVVAADINGDTLPDIVVGNKKGTFVHLREKRSEWQALFDGKTLANWEATKFGGEGAVRVADGQIVLEMGAADLTGITWTGPELPKTNYELSLQAMRLAGNDFFAGITFPVADSFCSLILGGWGGTAVGLSSVDGEDASQNETSQTISFDDRRWYDVRIRVTPGKIQAWVDERQIIDLDTTRKRIATRAEVELSQPLGVAAWRTKSAVRNVRLRRLS